MAKIILYKSNTGHTKKYAEMLGKRLNIDVYSVDSKDIKIDNNDEIIYMGWIFADSISGYKRVKDKYNITFVIAVGMNNKSDENSAKIVEVNKIEVPFDYLQGGVDFKKLKGVKKFILNIVAKSIIKKNRKEDKKLIEMFKNNSNSISEKNLDTIVELNK